MPRIIPITDLRNTTEISRICHEKNEPVFITKNGYGDMVIMSLETYEKLTEPPVFYPAVAEAEATPYQIGEDQGAKETFASLKRKQTDSKD